jgi:porin
MLYPRFIRNKISIFKLSLLVGSIVLAATGTPSFADESAEDSIWTRDHLLGDWGGLRSGLAEHGIYVDLRLTQIYQDVTDGGVDTGSEYGGVMDYIVNVDAEKLGLWKGLAFNVHAQTRYGEDINSKAGPLTLASTPLLYPLPGDYSGTKVTGAAVYQTFFDGKAQAFAGKLHTLDLVQGIFPATTHSMDKC